MTQTRSEWPSASNSLFVNVPCPVIIREALHGCRWEEMQRSTARHYGERVPKWEVFIKSLPSELRESYIRGRRKTVSVRRNGRGQGPRSSESRKQGTYDLTKSKTANMGPT